jgi:hypothetical protein
MSEPVSKKKVIWSAIMVAAVMITIMVFITLMMAGVFGPESNSIYRGEYPDLYTEVINSFVCARGNAYLVESSYQPVLEIIEEDSYGRRLFCYAEAWGRDYSVVAIMVSQKTVDGYVYYYPDYNYIVAPLHPTNTVKFYKRTYIQDPTNGSTEVEIEGLKAKNDWNKSIDDAKSIKILTSDRRKSDFGFKEGVVVTLFRAISANIKDSINYNFYRYVTSDGYGKNIVLAHGHGGGEEREYVFIINDDGTHGDSYYLKIDDIFNYQDQLKGFKDANNWGYE